MVLHAGFARLDLNMDQYLIDRSRAQRKYDKRCARRRARSKKVGAHQPHQDFWAASRPAATGKADVDAAGASVSPSISAADANATDLPEVSFSRRKKGEHGVRKQQRRPGAVVPVKLKVPKRFAIKRTGASCDGARAKGDRPKAGRSASATVRVDVCFHLFLQQYLLSFCCRLSLARHILIYWFDCLDFISFHCVVLLV